ncbi:MAG: Asp-tRNA(Asn)/Glu-tRNA(Gln) amidotransferase subunit GatA [Eubacteriales bacterium]|nr:Asp-tRNA(Asn)/Glu-tRNA(Gln) amidotransferase subunit GatA [Eubacteriales bacterium]
MMKNRISQIRSMLESKEISCTELTKKYLAAIDAENNSFHAFTTICETEALATAAKVDRRIAEGEKLMPLEGIPMSLKDNICTKDIVTSCCSKMLEDFVPIYDATVWAALKASNAVLLGKTNLDEFAMGSSSETSVCGGTLNPYSKDHVAGGSSGGSACAVAKNMSVYSLGSDTGGSVRQPSSFCGVVGLKPTFGAVSRYGAISYASSFDQIGPITASVDDAAEVFNAISFYDEMDATSDPKTKKVDLTKLDGNVRGMKIGVIREFFENGVKPGVLSAVNNSIKTLSDAGAEIVVLSMPDIKYAVPVYYILACAEASSNLGRFDGIRYGYKTDSYSNINEMIVKTRSEGFGKEVKRRILLGTYVLSSGYYDAYYKKAQAMRAAIKQAFSGAFAKVDAIIAPTVPTTAFKNGFTESDPIEAYMNDICTVPANIAGLPAISVPCGMDGALPVGAQLIGNRFCEQTILNIAKAIEQSIKF